MVGFSPWDGPDDGRLDDDVIEYLDAGDFPVIVTLGTSAASARPEVFDQALAALDTSRERAIILASNDQLAAELSDRSHARPLVRPFIPLAPPLRRSKAIIHSGAHGTNTLALLAGVPSVVVPCLYDQVANARRQQVLGTRVWVRRPRDLPAAVRSMLDPNGSHSTRARAFSNTIADEDGTARSVTEIDQILERVGDPNDGDHHLDHPGRRDATRDVTSLMRRSNRIGRLRR